VGDTLIIATYAQYNEIELERYHPLLVYVDSHNRIVDRRTAVPVQAA
jgi:aspartate 1-decarboxylase